MTEWRNIKDIIRLSIKSLTSIVRKQGLAIKEMSKSLNLKINKSDVELALSKKSEITEMNKISSELKN